MQRVLDKDTLKKYISDNRLNETVKSLLFRLNEFLDKNKDDIDYEPIRKLSDILIINSGKLNGLEQDKMLGVLDNEIKNITLAQVQQAVLYVIDQLPIHFWEYIVNQKNSNSQYLTSDELIIYERFTKLVEDKLEKDIENAEQAKIRTEHFIEKQNFKKISEKKSKSLSLTVTIIIFILGSITISVLSYNNDIYKNLDKNIFNGVISALFGCVIFHQILWRLILYVKISQSK